MKTAREPLGSHILAADDESQSNGSFASVTTDTGTIEEKEEPVKAKEDVLDETATIIYKTGPSINPFYIAEERYDAIEVVYNLEEAFPDDSVSTLPTFLAGEDTRNASKNKSTNAIVNKQDGAILRCVLNQPSFRRELALRYIQAIFSRRSFATFLTPALLLPPTLSAASRTSIVVPQPRRV